jgi:trehalose 6-phosphate synthase
MQRFRNQKLARVRPVSIGGIDQVHFQFDRSFKNSARLIRSFGQPRIPFAGEPHGAKPEPIDGKIPADLNIELFSALAPIAAPIITVPPARTAAPPPIVTPINLRRVIPGRSPIASPFVSHNFHWEEVRRKTRRLLPRRCRNNAGVPPLKWETRLTTFSGARSFATGRTSMHEEAKLIIVSNRGPNDFVWREDHWEVRAASGGLVSMIDPLARRPDVTWFCCVSEPPTTEEAREELFTTAADQTDPEHNIVPVPLPSKIYQAYYGAISNEVLWMLQHHLVGQFGYSSLDERRHRAWSDGYLEANRRIAGAIRESGITPRAFLIQDYHLYPLPALLREAFPEVPSLHFTHIPFPDAATLKLIPQSWRDSILHGLLGADVVGMQTEWDAKPFIGCCEELLGAKVDYKNSTVEARDGRLVRVRAFAASTDPAALEQSMGATEVSAARERLSEWSGTRREEGKQTIIRVDRLDPSKNQIIGFRAFGRLLELRPELRSSVRFLAFLVPSRTDLSVYRSYRDAVYATIQEVNKRFAADCGGDPIQVYYTNDRQQALAAMELCDVLLVNSREDGMNLVVKEWAIISRRPGVAVISETAGVATTTTNYALLVSPLDIEGTARAMEQALHMPNDERSSRLEGLRESVHSWDAADWLTAQLTELGVE